MQSTDKVEHLKKIFTSLDKNGDGQLDKDELVQGYKNWMGACINVEEEVDKIMNAADINKNGLIDYTEFLIANLKQEEVTNKRRLKEAFEIFDIDGNGQITKEELKQVMGVKHNEYDVLIDELIKHADVDGDGQISFNEFQHMMTKIYHT